jgi:HlyD family secretion protein
LKKWLLLLLIAAAGAIAWGVLRKSAPPKIPFARAKRQTLVSTLPTNGKVEPFEWQAVRAEIAGMVSHVEVREGQRVARGQVLATLTDPALQSEIEAAEARLAEARAGLAGFEAGGRPADFTDIDNRLDRARFELQQAKTEHETLQRLAEKQAATRMEVQAARDKVRQFEIEIAGLEKRRRSLVAKPDVTAAQARVRDAENTLALARQRAARSVARAPIAGIVYGLAVQPGAYVTVGTLIANVGVLDRVRVRVYVDEPELGRVAVDQPVTIRWQALSGKEWKGTVERRPSSIQALGSRQVGEVLCTIENPGGELIPGTNVDAEIRTAVVENAVVIPRESLRHDAAGDYVLTLAGELVERRNVKTGVSSVTLVEVVSGLREGDPVALPSETPVKPGDRVLPALPDTPSK